MSTVDYNFVTFEGFSPTPQLGPYRAADYWQLPEGAPVELIRGELVKSPAQRTSHQIIVGELNSILRDSAKAGGGLTIPSPTDVILSDHTILQPDALYISKARRGIVGNRVNGPPDLAVEVLSPGAERRDRVQKLSLYAEYGVKEFWIVDPHAKHIEFFVLESSGYVLKQGAEGVYQSPLLTEVKIDIELFWREVAERLPQG